VRPSSVLAGRRPVVRRELPHASRRAPHAWPPAAEPVSCAPAYPTRDPPHNTTKGGLGRRGGGMETAPPPAAPRTLGVRQRQLPGGERDGDLRARF
jgi:hypothetical protein